MLGLNNRSASSTKRSIRTAAGMGLAAVLVLGGVAGCGRWGNQAADDVEMTELSWDAQALQTLGYAPADLVAADTDATTAADGTDAEAAAETDGDVPRWRGRHPRLRYMFRHALHGEATVQTEEGVKTVLAQRGILTEATDATVTVSSSDGYTVTWTLGDSTVVVVDRARSTIDAVAVGTEVGVAGFRDGDTAALRLLVVPRS